MFKSARVRPIGIIHTPFKELKGCPIQPFFSSAEGTVEVFPEFRAGLKGIGRFSHIVLVYYFDRSDREDLVASPYLERRKRGIFTIRSPHRPNHIGISVVQLVSHRNGRLKVKQVDMLDHTPLLDIKPYVPDFDARPKASSGWLAKRLVEVRGAKA
ncbi:tRNA (N6-threonylcarbamoyladenosine(37)-N6)-methyltransferase TrmO [candidate division WOR-3 bacterium JGI_Cruoil_03_51_56]|uniref:tRNA (N6-threonylcarbamoyladenosine(37)-N6)-methyltransferase TrmO n=1 Tax=candidate division WOR-3 bacterium JGI_Cruoil_03_51_56 TaxID=1973747 RepID=A0A235BSA8_UNCW3|nr:MAG: tRNA (N6-threonylcarbamoyladenosine(37)-N6)-methyltransferase TrmO [candidate division WOR-3 bacterium JGI_Cruoil_03_51_56]